MARTCEMVQRFAHGRLKHKIKSKVLIALDRWLVRRPRSAIAATHFGFKVHVNTQDLIQRRIYMFGSWEPMLSKWLWHALSDNDTFIDIGANVGYFTLLAAKRRPSCRVVAVEPFPSTYTALLENLNLNGCANVRVVQKALDTVAGSRVLYMRSRRNTGAASWVPPATEPELSAEVECVALMDAITIDELRAARAIKIDVEGAEGAILQSLLPIISYLRDDVEIAVEISPERMATLGYDANVILEQMLLAGFYPYRLENDYSVSGYSGDVPHLISRMSFVDRQTDVLFSRQDRDQLDLHRS